jgi:tetratricopeptide (TPR) repeat protein
VERPIRKAVQLGGNLPGPWVALVLHLAETARRPEAEAAAEAAGRALTGPPRSLAVAQCLDILGEREKAGAAFRAAEQDNPTDLPTLRAAVEFFVRDEKPDRVRELCERILSVRSISDDDREFARKYIAMVLGTSRDADTRREALVRLGVLEGGVPTKLTGQETTDQLRTRALAFALQPDAALRREAIAALEAVDARRPLARQDEELLARLHTSVGDWESARKRLAKLAATHPDDLRYADALVFGLVRFQGSTKEARKYLDVLVKARPDTPRTVELAAHVLEAEGKTGEAVASLLAFAGKEPKHLPEVAAMVEQIGQEPRAEPLYRRLAADPARPDGPLVLAAYLGRLGRTDAALEVVRGVEGKFPPQALAAVGVGIVVASDRLSAERARLVQGWVAAIPPTPENRGLVLELTGILLTLQERYAEAAEVYREMVKLAPRDADHLNNLAFLLGVRGTDPDAGLEVLKRAKEVAGPRPNLLDTEGMILLAKGEARAAVRVLAAAAKESHDAAAYFHLALAHDRAGEKAEAANAIRVAQRLKIRPRSVLPAERADLERLLRWL